MGAAATGQTPRRGGVLNSVLFEDPPGLLIHESATVSNIWPMSPCYSNLVIFNPLKPLDTPETVIPELAERWSWQDTSVGRGRRPPSRGVTRRRGDSFTGQEKIVTDYYVEHGWDPVTGVPTPETIRTLDIEEDAAHAV